MDFPISRNQFLLPNAWSLVIVARMCRQAYTEYAVVYNHEAGCRAGHGGVHLYSQASTISPQATSPPGLYLSWAGGSMPSTTQVNLG